MQRAILLQTTATKLKQKALKEFSLSALMLSNWFLFERDGCKTFMQFHHKTLSASKEKSSFNVQVRCSLIRDLWKKKCVSLKAVTIKFNVPRNCKTFSTKANFFVELGMYPGKRLAVPIKQNRNYQRFTSLLDAGWQCKTFGLTSSQQIVAYLSKEETILPQRKNILGIDINNKCFAVSILSPKGKVLKQVYFGKDIWVRRKKLFGRREKLQSLADKGSYRAKKSLEKIKRREHNFVRNRLGEIANKITGLALKYNANIAIENLKRFKTIKSRKGKARKANKIIMKIPFYSFKRLLKGRCFDKGIALNTVDPCYTSKWCSHCGALAAGHSSNYSLFKCKCKQIVNSDRKASLAIAVKSLLVRNSSGDSNPSFFQFTNRRVPVNALLHSNEGFGTKNAVHNVSSPMERQRL